MRITRSTIIRFLFVGILLQSFLMKLPTGIENYIKYFDEVLLVLLLPFSMRGFRLGKKIVALRFFSIGFLLYIFMGFVSWINSDAPVNTLIIQTILSIKYPIVIYAIIGLLDEKSTWYLVEKHIKVLLIISIPLVIWQLALPSSYDYIFAEGAHHGKFVGFGGVYYSRAASFFWHPGEFAFFLSIAIGYFYFDYFLFKNKASVRWFTISALLLLSTLARQEIFSAIFLLTMFSFWFLGKNIPHIKIIILLFISLLFSKSVFNFLYAFYEQAEVSSGFYSIEPRVVFMHHAIQVANEYFPFGSGFGTFGGYASTLNKALYYKLGFEEYWWFNNDLFLTDTFWGNVLAESGWFGVTGYLISILSLIFGSMRMLIKNPKKDQMLLLYSLLSLALGSLTGAVYNSLLYIFLGSLFLRKKNL